MATILPTLTDAQLNALPPQKQAEVKFYKACRNLPADICVLYSVSWIVRAPGSDARDGEADFLLCSPTRGLLIVEVKGGGITFDPASGDWLSTDRRGEQHLIKDPFRQGATAKYSILSKLKEHPRWGSLGIRRLSLGHAAAFPDIADTGKLVRPDAPQPIIAGSTDLDDLPRWLNLAYEYWALQDSAQPLGPSGVQLVKDVFARTIDVKPLLAVRLAAEEQHRITLTDQQAELLAFLAGRRRVAISGGAGTGKSLLAVEKAKQLAGQGFRTLLTCYNRPLADHLATLCAGVDGLEVLSFHQLCYQRSQAASKASGRNLNKEARHTYPKDDEFDVLYPWALAESTTILADRYDAIVCDEGQDFRDEYWFPLELLLADLQASPLYVFFDDNQNLYSRSQSFPIKEPPFLLRKNCRNTRQIHEAAYRFYRGDPVAPSPIDGSDLTVIEAPAIAAQTQKIHNRIVDLIDRENVPAADIVVLISNAQRKGEYYEAIRHRPLPNSAKWADESPPRDNHVRIDTVNRFKGLESLVVFLWGVDDIDPKANRELLYVGLSRAKSVLYIVGRSESCRAVLNPNVSHD